MNYAAKVLVLSLLVTASVASPTSRELLSKKSQKKCRQYKGNKLVPPGAEPVLKVRAKGFRTFWCNNSKLYRTPNGKLHGQAEAKLYSLDSNNKPDKKCTGFHSYRENYGDGSTDGMPFFDIKCKGQKERNILATQKVQYREDAPKKNGKRSPLTYSRRKVVEDVNRKGDKAHWVVRTNTKSDPVPTSCKGDIDEIVPFQVDFTFYTCKYA